MDKRKGKKTTSKTSKAKPAMKKTTVSNKKKIGTSKSAGGIKKGTGAVKKTTVRTKKSLVGIKKGVIKSIKDLAGGKRTSKVDKFMGEMLDKKFNMQNRLKFKTTFISLTSRQKSELERKLKQSPVKQKMTLKKILKEIT